MSVNKYPYLLKIGMITPRDIISVMIDATTIIIIQLTTRQLAEFIGGAMQHQSVSHLLTIEIFVDLSNLNKRWVYLNLITPLTPNLDSHLSHTLSRLPLQIPFTNHVEYHSNRASSAIVFI